MSGVWGGEYPYAHPFSFVGGLGTEGDLAALRDEVFYLGVALEGRPSIPWGYTELVDMEDAERYEYVERLSDLIRKVAQKRST